LSSKKPVQRLQDIVTNAEAIFRYTGQMNFDTFSQDRKTVDAVERCLERISEAAAKLGDLAPLLMPDQPWQQIRAFGNRLRHEYDEITGERVWHVVATLLPSLAEACRKALASQPHAT